MNTSVEIYLWDTRIGVLYQPIERGYSSFEYDPHFRNSGIELSPLRMPLSNAVYEFPSLAGTSFHGLPGLVADSLPDKFGNAVIEQWLASQGKSIADFTAIDRLCYTGKRGMGALEYVPSTYRAQEIDEVINVQRMVEFASTILNDRESLTLNAQDDLTYAQLIQIGTSAGGARAKALIAWNPKTNDIRSGQLSLNEDYEYWLMKFDNVKNNGDHGIADEPEYTLIEYAYYLMAIDCGITMNECRIQQSEGLNHFMTKRFDRVEGKKMHMQSLAGLAHIDYNEPNLCSYEQAANYMRNIGLTQKEIEQFYRRMVFNCIAVNQDDHVKNISFLMDRDGMWTLAPAYDVTFSYNASNKWLRSHQMSINKKVNNIGVDDLMAAGKNMSIKPQRCKEIIADVSQTVNKFPKYASTVGIRDTTVQGIQRVMECI